MVKEKLSMEDVVKHVENVQQEHANRIVTGEIINIDKDNGTVLVDIGHKSEGIISLDEFEDEEIKAGDKVEVFIVKKSTSFEHPPILSHKRAKLEHQWEKLEDAFENELVIDAKLEKRVKGGIIARINGISAFMPASLVGYPMVKNLESVMGKTVPCKIIEFDRSKKNLVISWRKAIEEDVRRKREELFEQLYPGKIVKGKVSGIKSFGAFINLGGVDGLLHISELSWGHVDKVEDVLKVGQEVEVKVKNFNPNNNKISLSLKETKPHPWEGIEEKYKPGDIVEGKVTGLTNYGAFIELEPGVEGLVKTEEISWTEDTKHAGDALEVDKKINVKILDLDQEEQKIGLSIKQTEPNPWEEVAQNHQKGTIIEGEITHLTDFGAFVMLDEGVEGLIHKSDISWKKEIDHPSEALKVGQKVKAKILNIEPDKQKVSLGLKQLEENPYDKFPVGKKVKAKVKTVQRSGAYLEMDKDIEGYLHISNYSKERIDDLRDHLKKDQTIECKITKNNPAKKYIEVSVKGLIEDKEKKEMKKYMDSKESGATIYDLIGDKLNGLTEEEKE
ncbi:MAG: 30S ribosomal protein S1 [Elusimicrobiota bacterium]